MRKTGGPRRTRGHEAPAVLSTEQLQRPLGRHQARSERAPRSVRVEGEVYRGPGPSYRIYRLYHRSQSAAKNTFLEYYSNLTNLMIAIRFSLSLLKRHQHGKMKIDPMEFLPRSIQSKVVKNITDDVHVPNTIIKFESTRYIAIICVPIEYKSFVLHR